MIDLDCFPHILDNIIQNASFEALLTLRRTSREVCNRVDARIYRHIVFDTKDRFYSYLRTPPVVHRNGAVMFLIIADAVHVVDLLAECGYFDGFKVDVVRQYANYPVSPSSFFATTHIIWIPMRPHGDFQGATIDARHVCRGETLVLHMLFSGHGDDAVLSLHQILLHQTIKRVVIIFSRPSESSDGVEPATEGKFLNRLADILARYALEPFDMRITFVDLDALPSNWLKPQALGAEEAATKTSGTEDLQLRFLAAIKRICILRRGAGVSAEEAGTCAAERLRFMSSDVWRAEVGQELYGLTMSE